MMAFNIFTQTKQSDFACENWQQESIKYNTTGYCQLRMQMARVKVLS